MSRSKPDISQQIISLQAQMDQIQLNSITAQAQIEAKMQACMAQMKEATGQLQETIERLQDSEGAQSPYLKTSDAMRGIFVALMALYVQQSMSSKPVSKLSYTKSLRHVHLLMGVGVIGGIGSVQLARNLEPGPDKKRYMDIHKGSGVLMLAGLLLRIILRFRSAIPERFPGPKPLQLLEGLSHRGFYLLMFMLPTSGIAYTYYSGMDIPMLGFSKPDLEEADAENAQRAIDLHKKLGQFLEYAWVPFHFASLAYHSARGRSVVRRITPFP